MMGGELPASWRPRQDYAEPACSSWGGASVLHMHVCMYRCVHACECVHTRASVCVSIYVHVCVCACTQEGVYVCTHVHVCTHVQPCVHVHDC